MNEDEDVTRIIVARAMRRFERWQRQVHERSDRIFGYLFVGQWLFCIGVAAWVAPYVIDDLDGAIHPHVVAATTLGLGVIAFPLLLIRTQPGAVATRHVVAVAQMLLSALIIYVTNGRIESHFHVFGSLAFLAFYLDWKVLVTATTVTLLDHALRGAFDPRSIYGVDAVEWTRFVEHAFWILFALAFLVHHTSRTLASWLRFAEEGGMLEAMAESEWRARSVVEREREEREERTA
ncbi:MAG: hypothetical protein GXY23_01835 [Myxococcales bacterium]|nr:hypothetical protein [Myxococcales bacterium]